jgi:hypothetical protein
MYTYYRAVEVRDLKVRVVLDLNIMDGLSAIQLEISESHMILGSIMRVASLVQNGRRQIVYWDIPQLLL